jgi:hypothetical protein
MELPLPIGQKNHILKNYTSLATSRYPDNKLKTWFDALMTVPFGKYRGINLDSIKSKKVKAFLDNLQETMDKAVFGHEEAKRQIIQMMGQQIRNPKSKGNVIGIYGCPGNGKTSLVECRPKTGRTHQIRVHSKSIGHPLACDPIYGDGKPVLLSSVKKNFKLSKHEDEERPMINRLALHSYKLIFNDENGKPFELIAEVPKQFTALMKQIKKFNT